MLIGIADVLVLNDYLRAQLNLTIGQRIVRALAINIPPMFCAVVLTDALVRMRNSGAEKYTLNNRQVMLQVMVYVFFLIGVFPITIGRLDKFQVFTVCVILYFIFVGLSSILLLCTLLQIADLQISN